MRLATCPPGTSLTTPKNCGACGKKCKAPYSSCQAGKCTLPACKGGAACIQCDEGFARCEKSHRCLNMRTVENCGKCGESCSPLQTCSETRKCIAVNPSMHLYYGEVNAYGWKEGTLVIAYPVNMGVIEVIGTPFKPIMTLKTIEDLNVKTNTYKFTVKDPLQKLSFTAKLRNFSTKKIFILKPQ